MSESSVPITLVRALVSPVPSPCTSVCRMSAVTGYCEGCWRTLEEIARWSAMTDSAKRAVWAELEHRRSAA
jgi:predicted Fe-S protein YdhL (DUF1289 family)